MLSLVYRHANLEAPDAANLAQRPAAAVQKLCDWVHNPSSRKYKVACNVYAKARLLAAMLCACEAAIFTTA